jgi:putative transposase
MCRVLAVSVSGYYPYLRRPESWRTVNDDLLMAPVRIAFAERGETYGAPRVPHELRAVGLPTSTKRVARLMREVELAARPKPRRRVLAEEARRAIFWCIESWDHRKRRHSTLGYVRTAVYEA